MRVYTERTTGYVQVSFLDKDKAPATPLQVQYRIDCKTSGQVVRDWTSVVAAPTVEIVLTAVDQAMRLAANRNERRVMTVYANYGIDDELRSTCEWYVQNLDHVG